MHGEVLSEIHPDDIMTELTNWERARDWIRAEIAARRLAEGDRLPTEPDIQKATGLGRHSVRRAMAVLAAEGLLSIEQGRGTFVRGQPAIPYRIGRRTRFRENLIAAGRVPGGEALGADIVPAAADIAAALGLEPGAPVHRILRRGLADGMPISLTRSFHCARRFPDLGVRRAAGASVTEVYRAHGIADYHRRETRMHARLPEKWEARALEQPAEQPVIVMAKTDVAPDGTPLGFGESIWAAGRVRFELEGMTDAG